MEIHSMKSFFYVDDGIIASKCTDWIQWAVDVLTGIFEWVGPWENYGNIVWLVFLLCHIFVGNSDTAYGQCMIVGGGWSFQYQRVTICTVPVVSGGHGRRVAGDIPKHAELCQTWPPLGTPTPPKIAQNVFCVFPKGFKLTGMPSGGVTVKGS